MADFHPFYCVSYDIGCGVHDWRDDRDVLKVYASDHSPLYSDTRKADIPEINAGNGYPPGGTDIQNVYTLVTAWTSRLTGTDVTWTASGGNFGPFRYIVLYNSTADGDPLIGWWDYGTSFTVTDGGVFVTDFGPVILQVQALVSM